MGQQFDGELRIDFGPMRPMPKSMTSIKQNNICGLMCRLDTFASGRIDVQAFEDNAILNACSAFNREEKICSLVSVERPRKNGSLIYTLTAEDPEDGMLGDPIRSFRSKSRIRTAIAVHGKVLSAKKKTNLKEYGPLMIIEVGAKNTKVSSVLKFSVSTPEMRNLVQQVERNKQEIWVKMSGFGDIYQMKSDGKNDQPIYINSVQNFMLAYGEPMDYPIVGKALMKERMKQYEKIKFV